MPDKERERYFLDRLRHSIPSMPASPQVEGETPDFVLGEAPDRVGIEFTVFHLPPNSGARPDAERHALKRRIVARAEQLHAEAGGPALYVKVQFRPGAALSLRAVESVAEALSFAVRITLPPHAAGEPAVKVPWNALPTEIVSVRIHASVDGVDKLWTADHVGWVVPIQAEHIRRELHRKSPKAQPARQRCDILWLVVVNDVFSGAAFAELSHGALEATYHHPFDRVYWLEPQAGRAIELKAPAAV